MPEPPPDDPRSHDPEALGRRRQQAAATRRTARRRGVAALLILLLLAGGVFALSSGDDEDCCSPDPTVDEPTAKAPKQPNLIVVMTDDQVESSFTPEVMPATTSFFADGGTGLETAFAIPPLCCPARSGFLTGQYAHNHGVLGNDPGYPDLRHPDETLAVALDAAGYRTGMIGKYLNNYELVGGAEPAPGWDRWFSTLGYAGYYDYIVSDDGESRSYGDDVRDYSTSVYFRQAEKFVAEASKDRKPFFLWLTPNAPHTVEPGSGSCSGRYAQPPTEADFKPFADAPVPMPESFDEADVSDKPRWAQTRKRITNGDRAEIETGYRCALASLRAVDDGFADLVDQLERDGTLEDTVIVFVSDNGLLNGEHRIFDDKRLPLEPSIGIPMSIRLPSALAGDAPSSASELVSTVDLAPTLLDYAGVKPCGPDGDCWRMDGRSMRPLLEGDPGAWPEDRALPIELDDSYAYTAIRTPGYLYSEMTADRDGELPKPAIELYDLGADPDELENLGESTDEAIAAVRDELADRLAEQRRCSGIEGRDDESRRPFCE